jgi:nucleoside-diphosphate-sugar epimerase
MKKIAIIGAAGFVGQHLVALLSKKDFDITVITNHNGKMILGKYPINIISNLNSYIKVDFDIVINLAFPASAKPHEIYSQNDIILNIIQKLTSSSSRIIHISSLAVFGFKLDHDQILGPIKSHHDFPYVESKLYFENKLIKIFKNNKINIVRLGNIWGPNSAVWTLQFVKKLFFMEPFCSRKSLGFSNVTEVRNVVSYIGFLINQQSVENIHYHHLAEFSHYGWNVFIKELENLLKIQACYQEIDVGYSYNLTTDLANILSNISPLKEAKNILESRFLGSYLRSFINILSKNQQNRIIKKYGNKTIIRQNDSSVFLNVLSTKKQFINKTLSGWKPPIDFNSSMRDVGSWLNDIGYTN